MTDRTRHSDIFNASTVSVTLIGLGGIGALTAVTLAKMGVGSILAVDNDVVSAENIATQMHLQDYAGSTKVVAVRELIPLLVDDVPFDGVYDRVSRDTLWRDIANPVVISAVDSIASRKEIWAAIEDKPWEWYLDARMAAEMLSIYAVSAADRAWYRNLIADQNDENALEESCTSKATFYTANAAAAVLGSYLRRIATGIKPPRVFVWNILTDVMATTRGVL